MKNNNFKYMDQGKKLMGEGWSEEKQRSFEVWLETPEKKFTIEERAYRRGYHHGFYFSRTRPDIDISEVQSWRVGDDEPGPPGSDFEGKFIPGTVEN